MRKPRAIVFDDQATVLDIFRMILSRRGYEVLTYTEPKVCPLCEDDADICSELTRCADVIITDLKMPRMDGVELLRRQSLKGCKVDPENKAIISGCGDNGIEREREELGCAFFTKPLAFAELSEWLDTCESRMDLSRPLFPVEKRKQVRYPYYALVEYHCSGGHDKVFRSLTINRSESGMCLYLFEDPSDEKEMTIKTALPGISQRATLRWSSQLQDAFWIAGVMLS